jgi:uncharacterized membrane protein YfbV (UPF0208 family)
MTMPLVQLLGAAADMWLPVAVVVLGGLALWFARARENPGVGTMVLLAISIVAVLLPLFGYWVSGRTHPNAIGGLLPWNDAAGYYGCALRVLDGEGLSAFCQRRPTYSIYLAGLLRMASSELQLALLLQGLMNAAAIFAVAVVALRRWGASAAVFAVAMLAAFAATMSMATLTENVGFVLGACGLVLFASGAERRSALLLFLGAFILSFALNARSGAFLVLPMLVLWAFVARDLSRPARWRFGSLILVAAALGFVPGPLIVSLLGGVTGEIHSNLSYTLYGLVAGGERWIYALEVLPGATPKQIYSASWNLFLENPLLLVAGLFQGFLEYLQRLLTYILWMPARIALAVCWLWGLGALVHRRGGDTERVLGLVMLGVVASSPILSIDGDTRVYAATVAVDGFVVALGLSRLMSGRAMIQAGAVLLVLVLPQFMLPDDPRGWGGGMVVAGLTAVLAQWRFGSGLESSVPTSRSGAAFAVTIATLLVLTALPFWARADVASRSTDIPAGNCDGGEPIVARLGRDSPVLRIVRAEDAGIWPVATSMGSFLRTLHPLTHQHKDLRGLQAGQAIVFAHNLALGAAERGRDSFLEGNAQSIPVDGRTYVVCVIDRTNTTLDDVRLITAVHPLSRD